MDAAFPYYATVLVVITHSCTLITSFCLRHMFFTPHALILIRVCIHTCRFPSTLITERQQWDWQVELNRSPTLVNMECRGLDNADAIALAGAISACDHYRCIASVRLFANSIGDRGAHALAEAFSKCSALTHVDLRDNCLGSAGASAIADALTRHSHLHSLLVSFRDEGDASKDAREAANSLACLIDADSTLAKLTWDGPCAAVDVFPVATALRTNTHLQDIHIRLSDTVFTTATVLARGDRLAFRRAKTALSKARTVAAPAERSTEDGPIESHFAVGAAEFTLGGELGHGHFGAVHECIWAGSKVCVKRFFASTSADAESMLPLQVNEFALIHELGRDAVASLSLFCVFAEHFAVHHSGELWISLPWMNMGTLEHVTSVPGQVPEEEQLCNWLGQAASALAQLHARGIVHRDVAARNFLLERAAASASPTVKLSDFGLAMRVRFPWLPAVMPLGVWPPEVFPRQPHFEFSGDTFSFGLMLVDILNGGQSTGSLQHHALLDAQRCGALVEAPLAPEDIARAFALSVMRHTTRASDGMPHGSAHESLLRSASAAPTTSGPTISESSRNLSAHDDQSLTPDEQASADDYFQISHASSGTAPAKGTGHYDYFQRGPVYTPTRHCIQRQDTAVLESDHADALKEWRDRCALISESSLFPMWRVLIDWCTRIEYVQRPSVRLVACLLVLLGQGGNLNALPRMFMHEKWNNSPEQEADWLLLGVVMKQQRIPAIEWGGVPLSEWAVNMAAELLMQTAPAAPTRVDLSGPPFKVDAATGQQQVIHLPGSLDGRVTLRSASTLARGLCANKSLTALDLRWNALGADGIRLVTEALTGCATLTTLYLCGNALGDVGVLALARLLEQNTPLVDLRVRSNNIGSTGAKALFRALKSQPTLQMVDLHGNVMPTDAQLGAELVALIASNQSLTELNVSKQCGWTWGHTDEINAAIAANPRLRLMQ